MTTKSLIFAGVVAGVLAFSLPASASMLVLTGSAMNVSSQSATVSGQINASGINEQMSYRFEFGAAPTFGNATPFATIYGGNGSQSVNAFISGLQPGTMYYYRLVAQTATYSVAGMTGTFTTASGGYAMSGTTQNGYSSGNTNGGTGGYTSDYASANGSTASAKTGGAAGSARSANMRNSFSGFDFFSLFKSNCARVSQNLSSGTIAPGAAFSAVVSIKNACSTKITGTKVVMTIPQGVDITGANTTAVTASGRNLILNIGDVYAKTEMPIVIQGRVSAETAIGTMLVFPSVVTYKEPDGKAASIEVASTASVKKTLTASISEALKGAAWIMGALLMLAVFALLVWLIATEARKTNTRASMKADGAAKLSALSIK